MDLNDIWQEHKGFILSVLVSVVLFFTLDGCVVGGQEEEARRARLGVIRLRSRLNDQAIKPPLQKDGPQRQGLYDDETLAVMTREVKREEQAYETMLAATAFLPRETWNDTRMRLSLEEKDVEPSFTAAETARGVDDFWRRALATHWEGPSFSEHYQSLQSRGGRLGTDERTRYEEFLIGVDLADRVLHLAGHHRVTSIEVQGLGQRASGGTDEKPAFLEHEVPVRFTLRASSIQVRTFLQDLLGGTGEGLGRNASGELSVPIETGSETISHYRRVGGAWPLQIEELEWEPLEEREARGEATELVRFTVMARVFREEAPEERQASSDSEE